MNQFRRVLRISQHAVPHLEKTKGAIVNVSSIAAQHRMLPVRSKNMNSSTIPLLQIAVSLLRRCQIRARSDLNPNGRKFDQAGNQGELGQVSFLNNNERFIIL